MDGVISSYGFGKPLDFKNKRPLFTSIKTLSKLVELENIELHILSVCRLDSQIIDKNDWLDKYALFLRMIKEQLFQRKVIFIVHKKIKIKLFEITSIKETNCPY